MDEKYKNYLNVGTIFGILAFFSGLYMLYDGNTLIGISGSLTGLLVAYTSSIGATKDSPK